MKNKYNAIIKFAVCAALLGVAYFPTFVWMFERWMEKESYYGHGFIIPLVSAFILWQRRDALKKVKIDGDAIGLWLIIPGLLIHLVCAALKVYFISGFSFVLVLYGLVLFIFGKNMARNLTFPILFLLAMVPLPLVIIGNLTVKLKLFVAQVSTIILNHIGFPAVRDGSVIRMPNSFIAVEAPCSGLRSLISLLTLGLIFAYAAKVSFAKKAVIFASAAPIAMITNIIRILMLAIVNDLYGGKVAMGLFHDATGFVVFGLAFIGLYSVVKALEPKYAS